MSSKGASRLNLAQCLEIQANQFRARNCKKDYEPEEVMARIWEITARKDEKALNTLLKERNAKAIERVLGADEGQAAQWDYKQETEYLVLENGFSLVAIPPRIMEF